LRWCTLRTAAAATAATTASLTWRTSWSRRRSASRGRRSLTSLSGLTEEIGQRQNSDSKSQKNFVLHSFSLTLDVSPDKVPQEKLI
jgi:hypothetical protein